MNNLFYSSDEMESIFRSKDLKDLDYSSPYTIDEIVNRMRKLNNLNFSISKDSSIAIVGNSGKLLKKEHGELIDSHDYVFRCNLARVEGYESHVGAKTDFRFIAGKSFWHDLTGQFSMYDANFLTSLQNQHFLIKAGPMYPAIKGIIKNYNTKCNISFIRESFIYGIHEQIGMNHHTTLGFLGILMCLQWSRKISIFGFSFFEEDWNNAHYYESITPYGFAHNVAEEKVYVNHLKNKEVIKVY